MNAGSGDQAQLGDVAIPAGARAQAQQQPVVLPADLQANDQGTAVGLQLGAAAPRFERGPITRPVLTSVRQDA